MKNLKNNIINMRGITLISLIITIIVLLILAGVVINMTIGNNGIINKAQGAVDMYKNAQEKENIEIAKVENEINSYVNGNRGTVTISEEEYAMFKSQFSKNTEIPVVSINKPNTWEVSTTENRKEYNFGDEVYGQRFTGTINITAANTHFDKILDSTLTNITPISFGGEIANMNLPYFWYAENKKYASQMYYNQYGLAIYASRGDAAGITNYDVWMLYKKNS